MWTKKYAVEGTSLQKPIALDVGTSQPTTVLYKERFRTRWGARRFIRVYLNGGVLTGLLGIRYRVLLASESTGIPVP